MSIPLTITGISYITGRKLVAAVFFPTGLSTAAGTTLAGGSVSGTTSISTSATTLYLGLTESPSGLGEYGATSTLAGTALPDTTNLPYTRRVVEVASGTDMTSYAAITTAFASPVAVADTEEPLNKSLGGFLKGGVWSLPSQVQAYATGQDPGTYVLATPANKLATGVAGAVTLASSQNFNNTGQDPSGIATAVALALAGQQITVQSPVMGEAIEVIQGDAMLAVNNRALVFTVANAEPWPLDLTGRTITLRAAATAQNAGGTTTSLTASGSIVVATGSGRQVQVELTATQTATLAVGQGTRGWAYALQASDTNGPVTLRTGLMSVIAPAVA